MTSTIVRPDTVMAGTAATTVSEICAPVLLLSTQLRAAQVVEDPGVLRRRTRELVDRIEIQLSDARLSRAEVSNIAFALVALIDESISQSSWSGKAEWIDNPMQKERFQRIDAGEEFFKRLSELQRDRDARGDVLSIFYLCLTLGFKGRYGLLGEEEFDRLVRDVAEQLRRKDGRTEVPLAPHAKPGEQLATAVRQIPVWVFAVVAIGVAFVVYIILYIVISWRATDIDHLLR